MQEINLKCPCCKAKIIVDPETGGILKYEKHKEAAQSLDEFLKSEKTRSDDLAAKFAEAREKEDSKKELLDKKFEWAKKNKDKLPEAPKPDIFWD
jgi:hypothetical protein